MLHLNGAIELANHEKSDSFSYAGNKNDNTFTLTHIENQDCLLFYTNSFFFCYPIAKQQAKMLIYSYDREEKNKISNQKLNPKIFTSWFIYHTSNQPHEKKTIKETN